MAAMRWRRLDLPGTDRCELERLPGGWLLRGVAEFRHGEGTARLEYAVACDERWRTTRGQVHGSLGTGPLDIAIERGAEGDWTVDGRPAPALHGLVDLDLGFTPATNLFPLRRLALAVGESADAGAAWLDDGDWTLRALPQRYERRDETTYWYESPTAHYTGLLRVSADGFVVDYPELWRADD
jgi:hypothetical protein